MYGYPQNDFPQWRPNDDFSGAEQDNDRRHHKLRSGLRPHGLLPQQHFNEGRHQNSFTRSSSGQPTQRIHQNRTNYDVRGPIPSNFPRENIVRRTNPHSQRNFIMSGPPNSSSPEMVHLPNKQHFDIKASHGVNSTGHIQDNNMIDSNLKPLYHDYPLSNAALSYSKQNSYLPIGFSSDTPKEHQRNSHTNFNPSHQPVNFHRPSFMPYNPNQGVPNVNHIIPANLPFPRNVPPPGNLPFFPPNMPWPTSPLIPRVPFAHVGTKFNSSHETEMNYTSENVDKTLIKEWLEQRKIKKEHDKSPTKNDIKLGKAKKMIAEYITGITKLKSCQNTLLQHIKSSEDHWQKDAQKALIIKENLCKLQDILFCKDFVVLLHETIKKCQKKRERQRKNRKRRCKAKEDNLRKAAVLHQKIDDWRHDIISKINAKKLADSLKSEAGKSLIEVRKKKSESSKYLEKLTNVRELRRIRRETALQRGIFVFGKEDEKFENRVEGLIELTKSRLDNYKNEEKTLLVMLEEEKEQIQQKDEKERKRVMKNERLLLFGYDPLLECRRYWLQAEENPISLVQLRRLWDVYLVPETMPGADRIPDGWVETEPGKNSTYNRYLNKNKINISKD